MNQVLAFICVSFIVTFFPNGGSNVINVVYSELPPFLYRGEGGDPVGIIPNITTAMSEVCEMKFNFSLKMKSGKHFSTFMVKLGSID